MKAWKESRTIYNVSSTEETSTKHHICKLKDINWGFAYTLYPNFNPVHSAPWTASASKGSWQRQVKKQKQRSKKPFCQLKPKRTWWEKKTPRTVTSTKNEKLLTKQNQQADWDSIEAISKSHQAELRHGFLTVTKDMLLTRKAQISGLQLVLRHQLSECHILFLVQILQRWVW